MSTSLSSKGPSSASVASASVSASVGGASASGASVSASLVKLSVANNRHKENGLAGLVAGDIIYRPLSGVAGIANYCHYGVYVGKNEVIHFTEDNGKGKLEKVSLEDFADGRPADIQTNFSLHGRHSKKDTAMKALEIYQMEDPELLEEWAEYNLMSNNCEHFANYCATGVKYSIQTLEFKQ